MTVGGGIRTVEDAHKLFSVGADKIAVNTAAVANPALITEIARRFGSQAMIVSIEAKRDGRGRWEAYTDCGRERTSRDVLEWAEEAVGRGAGEILLTSVDQEGTCRGFDLELVHAVATRVSVPVIASGGMGTGDHFLQAIEKGADAVAMAHVLHFGVMNIPQIREIARAGGIMVRQP
jgi:cyclase